MFWQIPALRSSAENVAESLRLTRINYGWLGAFFIFFLSVRDHRREYVVSGKSEDVPKANQWGVLLCKRFLK